MMQHSEADLAVGGVILSEERFHAVKYSYPYLYSEMTFLTDKLTPLAQILHLFTHFH